MFPMKKVFLLILFLMTALGEISNANQVSRPSILQVSLPELLVNKDNYNMQHIRVTGYLIKVKGTYWLSLFDKGAVIFSSVELDLKNANTYVNDDLIGELFDVTGVFSTCLSTNCISRLVVSPGQIAHRE